MKPFFKALITLSIAPLFIIGCKSPTPTPTPPMKTPDGKLIHLGSDYTTRPIPQKITPYTYTAWTAVADNLRSARDYEKFLEQQGVGNIIPSFELLRTARDWQKCGKSQYMVPSRELWSNQVPTLTVFKYLVASKVLTDFEVTSVYRDLPLNKCAGGASSSRHLFNSAIDFRIGPQYPTAEDYVFIESTKFRLCQFWSQYGQTFNMGLGLYSTGQIHIDTQGYRTWGPDTSRRTSPCNY